VQCDQTIALEWFYSAKGYPARLRRIRYWDAHRGKRLVFLTNNFTLPAHVIAELYRRRWHVELFFKWIKQHLRIKAFYGHFGERRQDPGLDRHLQLPAGGHRPKRLNLRRISTQCCRFSGLVVRKSTDKSSVFSRQLARKPKRSP